MNKFLATLINHACIFFLGFQPVNRAYIYIKGLERQWKRLAQMWQRYIKANTHLVSFCLDVIYVSYIYMKNYRNMFHPNHSTTVTEIHLKLMNCQHYVSTIYMVAVNE